ncbi:MAG: pyruvate kinase, partial [Usitatibacter sp.]
MQRSTKIVATLGPSSSDAAVLERMFLAGVDVVRLNFSHGSAADHIGRAELVRDTCRKVGRTVGIMADLQGPKIRVGDLEEPMRLETGGHVTVVGAEELDGHKDVLPVSPAILGEVLKPGHDVLIDDGRLRLQVESVEGGRVTCAVITGGTVTAHKGVNVPGVPIPIPSLTRKDLEDLDFALHELDVDYVALSFVR